MNNPELLEEDEFQVECSVRGIDAALPDAMQMLKRAVASEVVGLPSMLSAHSFASVTSELDICRTKLVQLGIILDQGIRTYRSITAKYQMRQAISASKAEEMKLEKEMKSLIVKMEMSSLSVDARKRFIQRAREVAKEGLADRRGTYHPGRGGPRNKDGRGGRNNGSGRKYKN